MWPMKRSRHTSKPDALQKVDRHLGTGHLNHDLVARSVRGGIVTLGAQGAKVALQIVAVVLLARLLAPADFGIFAMVAAFLVALEILKDLGFQRQPCSARRSRLAR